VAIITAYVGLGGNQDNPVAHVSRALAELDELDGCRVSGRSPLFRSAPLGPAEQDWYVNAVAEVRVSLQPLTLLRQLQALEKAHGRAPPTLRWGPRPLDLDILLYGDRIIDTPDLAIPHPGLTSRNFVVYPLLHIAPDLVLPDGRPLSEVAAGLKWEGLKIIEQPGVSVGGSVP